MRIRYEVYWKDYWNKKVEDIGSLVDYWSCVDLNRGRTLAKRQFGSMVKDPDALFVLERRNKDGKSY